MRLLISTCILIGSSFLMNAQTGSTEKGIILIKGTLVGVGGLESSSFPAGSGFHLSFKDGTSFNLNAGGGFFVGPGFAIGGDIGIQYLSVDGESSTEFALRPFGRYYFNEKFYLGGGFNNLGIEDADTYLDIEGGYTLYIDDLIAFEGAGHLPLYEGASLLFRAGIVIFY